MTKKWGKSKWCDGTVHPDYHSWCDNRSPEECHCTCPCHNKKVIMNKKYDSTIARIAGNIVGHWLDKDYSLAFEHLAYDSVRLARMIAAEVERTEPKEDK